MSHATLLFRTVDHLIQGCFILAIVCVLCAKFSPRLRDFLKYGKTLDVRQQRRQFKSTGIWITDQLLRLQIPKVWFSHFYVLSLVLSSISFTLIQLIIHDYHFFVTDFLKESTYGACPIEISRLVVFLMVGHSLRRTSETLIMMNYKRSRSKMNISHYLVGLFFYSSFNIQLLINTNFKDFKVSSIDYSMSKIDYTLILPVLLFFISSLAQFLHHMHLSKLVKYNTPSFGLFKVVCCAHYLDEILIYLSILALFRNLTTFFALIWVIVNLSVSSLETRAYYKKHRDGKIPKYSIVPFVL